MIYPDLELEIPADLGRVHFVGIGGSGMSGIARMMHQAGVPVTGSDRSANYSTVALEELGIPVAIGHDAANVGDADTLVVTGALWQDNPEYQRALAAGLPVLHRSQALAWLARGKRVVSVAGAHGKTTSTGMIVTGLLGLGADPSFVNGGIIESLGVSSGAGSDELFVIEADESDKSFLLYDTAVALITNVDPEHLDFYGSREAFMQAFVDFARGARELVVISADDPGALEVLSALRADTDAAAAAIRTFGEAADADVRIVSIDDSGPVRFTVEVDGEQHTAQLRVFGRHNAVNAVGALASLTGLGFPAGPALAAIAEFGGTKRRFEFHAEVGGVRVYDDYAHHPTEVAALLDSARAVVGEGRLVAIHQPHLYSRTSMFHREFAEVLEQGADYTVVLAVDGAREDPVPEVTGALVSNDFTDQDRVAYVDDWQRAAEHLAEIARPGDVMVTMSCGTVYRIIPQVVDALRDRFEATGK
ncbi:UDP-N-acetylmuramate--L-alanine ligase [Leucobacter luti]|uniref:UDP-N-acetylmuramate--L-alanine ligase n=1 Tax=Leucobacter luti TaxID=340320 RepID=A0A4V6MBI3_9MICO|nr:UDP-N-acetylmuramate--L-alanine ligase [Leucobacter luti]MBL3700111.1 UDP-N-acetylmuramate--L-alanine ligase [Leucobacter luti]RZT61169.1 UDP-N-acetylmuramate--L-alanine ligase [Leucobacter luti]